MSAQARVLIDPKETEAILWCIAEIGERPHRVPEEDSDPLAVLLAAGFERQALIETCGAMEATIGDGWMNEPSTALEKAILRCCVENTSWVAAYIQNGPAGGNEHDARRTLRGLAKKLDALGIEVSYIAND